VGRQHFEPLAGTRLDQRTAQQQVELARRVASGERGA